MENKRSKSLAPSIGKTLCNTVLEFGASESGYGQRQGQRAGISISKIHRNEIIIVQEVINFLPYIRLLVRTEARSSPLVQARIEKRQVAPAKRLPGFGVL